MATTNQLDKGGLGSYGTVSVFHTGDTSATSATMGTDTTPVVTETYIARIFFPIRTELTGISLLNGSAVAGNVTVALFDLNGCPIVQSATTAQAGTAAYQDIPFTRLITVRGPGLHYVGIQFDSTSARFRTHAVGRFTTLKQTAQTYGTFLPFTTPNSFTTAVGPICSSY